MTSIQRRLTFTLLTTVLALAAAAGAFLYFFARSRLTAEFDRSLTTEAQAVSSMVTRDSNGNLEFNFVAAEHPEFHEAKHIACFEIWHPDGKVFSRSPSLGGGDLPRLEAASGRPRAQALVLPGGRCGRVVVLAFIPHTDEEDEAAIRAKGGSARVPPAPLMTLAVAREPHELDEALWVLGSSLLLAGLALALGTVLVVMVAVRRGLSPLHRLAAEADRIDAGSLHHRFSEEDLPLELQPICGRLNQLLERLAEAFARERRFTSDAAHELRTPIAELRSMAEVAMRWPQDARPEQTYRDTLAIANQMESMVTALLSIARCEAGLVRARRAAVDLAGVVREAWGSHVSAGARRNLSAQCDLPASATIESDRSMLLPLVGNLLANAFAHTPEGGRIDCRISGADGHFELEISNTCYALSATDLPHLFEPFWRKDPARSGGTHCGLGLSLVAAYAQALGTTPQVRIAPEGMFHVLLRFAASEREHDAADLPQPASR